MLPKRPLRRVTAQINSGAVFVRSDAVLPRKVVPAKGSGKPCGQRLKLRLRLSGGRLLLHPPEQFQSEIALKVALLIVGITTNMLVDAATIHSNGLTAWLLQCD
jgi:hypothetical protein